MEGRSITSDIKVMDGMTCVYPTRETVLFNLISGERVFTLFFF